MRPPTRHAPRPRNNIFIEDHVLLNLTDIFFASNGIDTPSLQLLQHMRRHLRIDVATRI